MKRLLQRILQRLLWRRRDKLWIAEMERIGVTVTDELKKALGLD